MKLRPSISVVLPTCNGQQHIAEALRSLLAQTEHPFELVVSDSGSTDDTLALIQSELSNAPFPLRILPRRTPGKAANWNAAMAAARGEFVKFLFQDDALAPTCLEKFAAAIEEEPRLGMAWCSRDLIVEAHVREEPATRWLLEHPTLDRHLLPLGTSATPGSRLLGSRELLDGAPNKVGEPTTVMVRTDLANRLGGFNPQMVQLADVELWHRIFACSWVRYIDQHLASCRVHPNQSTAGNPAIPAEPAEQAEMTRAMSQPEIYRLLHPRVRRILRQHCKEYGLDGTAAYPLKDRCYESMRWMTATGGKLLGATRRLKNKHENLNAAATGQLPRDPKTKAHG